MREEEYSCCHRTRAFFAFFLQQHRGGARFYELLQINFYNGFYCTSKTLLH